MIRLQIAVDQSTWYHSQSGLTLKGMDVKNLPVDYAKYIRSKMIYWKQELQKFKGLKIAAPNLLDLPLTTSDNWQC